MKQYLLLYFSRYSFFLPLKFFCRYSFSRYSVTCYCVTRFSNTRLQGRFLSRARQREKLLNSLVSTNLSSSELFKTILMFFNGGMREIGLCKQILFLTLRLACPTEVASWDSSFCRPLVTEQISLPYNSKTNINKQISQNAEKFNRIRQKNSMVQTFILKQYLKMFCCQCLQTPVEPFHTVIFHNLAKQVLGPNFLSPHFLRPYFLRPHFLSPHFLCPRPHFLSPHFLVRVRVLPIPLMHASYGSCVYS